MSLDLAFWAVDEADARRQAEAWIAAEPNVESGTVTNAVPKAFAHPEIAVTWRVSVELILRKSEQPSLWDAAA